MGLFFAGVQHLLDSDGPFPAIGLPIQLPLEGTDPIRGAEGVKDFLARYPKAQVRQFDGDPRTISELDAVISYLQMLGTLVDFAKFDAAGPNLR